MKYIKGFLEHKEYQKIQLHDFDKWKEFIPKELNIITRDGEFKFKYDEKSIIDYSSVQILYSQNTLEETGDPLADGEPDTLELDIKIMKNNDGTQANPDMMRLNIDVTYGDTMVSEFTVDAPSKVIPYHYTSVDSVLDPETIFAFSDDSIKELCVFFNRFSKNFKLTPKEFTFLDASPDSYIPNKI